VWGNLATYETIDTTYKRYQEELCAQLHIYNPMVYTQCSVKVYDEHTRNYP
jgi:hypothetical protein